MAISSLNFIISQFESEKYRYFAIYDEDGDRVYFTIRVFSKKLSDKNNLIARDNSTIAKYNVEVSMPVLPQGVNGLTGMGGNPMLPPDDPRSNAPNMFQLLGQMSQVEQQMKLMEKDHAHYREMKELQDRIY
mgnify:CR=1 FL=1